MKRQLINTHQLTLSKINVNRESKGKTPIQWEKMPIQEIYVHIYGWNTPYVSIENLLTPKEKVILVSNGYKISNTLKSNEALLRKVRVMRKNTQTVIPQGY